MSPKTRILITTAAALALAVAVLAVALAQCGGPPVPGMGTPGATKPRMPSATAGPTPTFTKEEELVATARHDSSQSVSSPEECGEVLKTEPWCNVTKYAARITRPEWEELLPQTEFYLIKYDLYGGESVQQHNLLIVEQDGQRYGAETFDRLLEANGITAITDENREPIAQAFALMTIPDYLEGDVVFTGWEVYDVESALDVYRLTAWTQIQGLDLEWAIIFAGEQLDMVSGPGLVQYGIGDYIDIPRHKLPYPSLIDYRFPGE